MIGQSNDGPVRTVLRMRARGGCEEAFESAWQAAAAEISRVPGNVRQELIRDAADPRSFLITCDWIDHAALDGFGQGALRDRVGAALHDLRESADRSTYDVLYIIGAKGPSIRVCVTVAVAPGQEAAYERAYGKVAERMRGTPGHVREELLREAGTSTYHLFAEWETEEAFNAWADDPAHNEQTAPLLPYLVESFQRTLYEIVARPPESPSGQAPFGPAPSVQVSSVRSQAEQVRAPRTTPPTTVTTDNLNGGSTVDSLTDVLVVGAGPAGLTTAIELARRGVACRLIDKNTEPSGAADKAIGIHSRTMEIWENIGIAREAMDTGTWLHGQTVYVNGRQTHQVNWDLPDLPYAHLGLPQYETERILTGLLAKHGVGIERGSELHSLVQDEDSVSARVVRTTGEVETIRARYLVGCDGAHSSVRRSLGLNFEGGMGMFPQVFMLGDVDLDWSMPAGHLLRFIQLEDEEMTGMLVCVPLRGRGRYRVATLAPPHLSTEVGSGSVPPGFVREYTPPALSDIQAVVDELGPAGTSVTNLRWSSIFRIKHGIVERYRQGRVLVAGDAAHLHPPAGGQGMNTGIQDAWNLGWKLALTVRGVASPGLLDSYEAERRPAGKAVMDRAVRIAFTDEMDMDDEKEQFLTEMQMNLSYAGSPFVGEALDGSGALRGGPGPGDRAPDVHNLRRYGVGHPLRLFELTRGTAHTLLLYGDATTSEEDLLGFEKVAEQVRAWGEDLIAVYVLVHPDATVPSQLDLPVLRDAANAFQAGYGVRGASGYLIRPDGHVGFRSAPLSPTALNDHLAKVFAS